MLPRGGFLLATSIGYLQFGAPPETIKDTMNLPEGVPSVFVLPVELFNWVRGISIAELEFPIYYNFFIRKQKTRIICYQAQAARFRRVLQESLLGPEDPSFAGEFTGLDVSEDLRSEMDYFRTMELDDVVEFVCYHNDRVTIDDVVIQIDIRGNFDIHDKGEFLAHVPGRIEYKTRYFIGEKPAEPFMPPLLGVTSLGTSSGFDPESNTSGFIFWINHHGIMVDPPVNATEWLVESNVSPKYIDSIILTHCHADHDAGTFQKILEESRITIYTTETIMQSFLRKYAALTNVTTEYLSRLFEFSPVRIGEPVLIHGALFTFCYRLHSIPTIGFYVSFQGLSIVYSSDHNNNPDIHEKFFKEKIISQERYDQLKNFKWDADVIFHESGMAPLHTLIEYIHGFPKDIRGKLYLYHIPEKEVPDELKDRMVRFGIEHTIEFDVPAPQFENAYGILRLLQNIEFARDLSLSKTQEFISILQAESFSRGDVVIQRGDPGDKFYIISSGNVSITSQDGQFRKIYGAGDYFGEAALLSGEKRSADIVAETDCVIYSIEKDQFLIFIAGTEYESILAHLTKVRDEETWDVLSSSEPLSVLTSTQRIWLESLLQPVEIADAGDIWSEGDTLDALYILRQGQVTVTYRDRAIAVLIRGDLVGCSHDLYEGKQSRYSYRHTAPLSLYRIEKEAFKKFLDQNPGLIMKLRYDFSFYFETYEDMG